MIEFTIQEGYPDFKDLPWNHPIDKWAGLCQRLEEVQRGISRHAVVFVNYGGDLFAIKELPQDIAKTEYHMLLIMQEQHLPCVTPIGYAQMTNSQSQRSMLITKYLDFSLPYRSLFMHSNLGRYREHLLDAMAGLLVQLHLSGIFWGDCSLSNTLFRRDAGALQAYLVDAETAEYHPDRLSPMLRHHDLQIMQENVHRDMLELEQEGNLPSEQIDIEIDQYIRISYRALWEEVTREDIIHSNERFRIHERIRALNLLGFSVKDIQTLPTEAGDQLRLRVLVTDRNFHRDQLLELTGLASEEKQSRQIMNEIHELRAYLTQSSNRSIPLSVAAYHWLQYIYQPTIERLKPILTRNNPGNIINDPVELYCQVLEHKWYLSEAANHDVGHQTAAEDYVTKFGALEG